MVKDSHQPKPLRDLTVTLENPWESAVLPNSPRMLLEPMSGEAFWKLSVP